MKFIHKELFIRAAIVARSCAITCREWRAAAAEFQSREENKHIVRGRVPGPLLLSNYIAYHRQKRGFGIGCMFLYYCSTESWDTRRGRPKKSGTYAWKTSTGMYECCVAQNSGLERVEGAYTLWTSSNVGCGPGSMSRAISSQLID